MDRLHRINEVVIRHALERYHSLLELSIYIVSPLTVTWYYLIANTHRSQRFIGRVQPVLVEEINLKVPRQLIGRNPHGRIVYFEGDFSQLRGKVVDVVIEHANPFSLVGKIDQQ